MNLCWLISTAGGGGGASVALSCCRQAAAAGHNPTLLVMGPTHDWLEEYAHDFPVESLQLEEGERAQTPRRLLQWLDENPQDVLFHNDVMPAHPAIPYLPDDLRFVYVVHDTAEMYWHKAVEHEPHLDAIVGVSNVIADQFRDKLDNPDRLHVAHNGTLFPDNLSLNGERRDDLVFLGGGKHIKGAYDTLDLWQALVKRSFDGKLHWFGTIDEALSARIEALPRSEQIEQWGYSPRSDIFETAAHSKVILMLSRVEPFGMATVEGMGMGCLPVAWNIETGTTEIATDGETGFFAPLGDVDALAEQVFTAIEQHDTLSESVIEHTRAQFSEEAMWDRYASVIDTIMDQPVAKRPHSGEVPPQWEPPTRYFQLLPESVRAPIRKFVGRSPWLGYLLRDFRGY
ncbi:glycosyltransferase family 4 protein [Salinibacter ruber]|uniref:Glycosyltransferase involved in cell wall biosynthesis n=1 Tax=Salinibacter ruber TaxID=146919 RepID=A0A9X2V7D0_9BACT|nr:glycosyltransferase family 4 protein [Salinibacter ruber]MCS4122721.1 glycosyltransferase involved in cell wall biosynthesis [Salinibacter ruber]